MNENECGCRQCRRERDEHFMFGGHKCPIEMAMMIVCQNCGNKRCPHASDHRHACTGSNDVGQSGGAYA